MTPNFEGGLNAAVSDSYQPLPGPGLPFISLGLLSENLNFLDVLKKRVWEDGAKRKYLFGSFLGLEECAYYPEVGSSINPLSDLKQALQTAIEMNPPKSKFIIFSLNGLNLKETFKFRQGYFTDSELILILSNDELF